MDPFEWLHVVPYAVSLAISAGVGIYTWRRRATAGAGPFALMAFSQAIWTSGYICELLAGSLSGKIFWDNFQLFGGFGWGLFFLAFTLQYTGRRLRHPRMLYGPLFLPALVYIVLAFTDSAHHLIRPDARLIPGGTFGILTYSFTTATWLAFLLLIGVFLGGGLILGARWLHAPRPYKAQIGVVLLGSFIPLVGVTLTMAGITLTRQRDTTPLSFALSNLVMAWGLFRYHLFDLAPVAREAVFENLNDAIVVLDARERVIDLNPVARRLFGWVDDALLGRPAGEALSGWRDVLDRVPGLEDGQVDGTVTVEGKPRHFILTLSSLRDRSGRSGGRVIIAHDVTRLKRVEAELRQRTEELEASNRRLEAANSELEAANRELDSFSSSVSHDLRAPLRAVAGFAQILREEHSAQLPEEARGILQRICRGAERMDRLIDALLEFSRLSLMHLSRRATEPAVLARRAFDELQATPDGARSKVEIGGLPPCQADPLLLQQVFANLLGNAVKFTRGREEPAVEVGSRCDDGETVYYVRDNGVGFEMNHAGRLFRSFQRLHAAEEFEGTGVGLAIVKRIIERHGGRVWAEAEENRGATFCFTIPEPPPHAEPCDTGSRPVA